MNTLFALFVIVAGLAAVYVFLSLFVEWREYQDAKRAVDWDLPDSISSVDGNDPMDRPSSDER